MNFDPTILSCRLMRIDLAEVVSERIPDMVYFCELAPIHSLTLYCGHILPQYNEIIFLLYR